MSTLLWFRAIVCQILLVALVSSTTKIWPLPMKVAEKDTVWSIDPENLKISVSRPCEIIKEAIKRYRKKFCYNTKPPKSAKEKSVTFIFELCVLLAYFQSWGALRALESFDQLIYYDKNLGCCIDEVIIYDKPRFPHRGIDSRHYLSLNALKATLELMAQNKFNVFHWHIVDEQAFPYASRVAKEFQKGAYSPKHIYTINQVKYARLRGIRVIPEFDTPGHTHSWGIGYPELLTRCFKDDGDEDPYRSLIDPSKEHSYDIILNFLFDLQETFEVFPDRYFHLGGDEAEFWIKECWQNNKNITNFMQMEIFGNNFSFQEVFDSGFAKDGLVAHVWKGNNEQEQMSEVAKITKLGYRTLLSSCWYLDHIARRADWLDYYSCDPQKFNGTETQKELVLGGEAALWGEWVDDSNVISRLFPRASAIAERLWSDPTMTSNSTAAWPRCDICRMKRQGYPVQPVNGPGFCEIEYQTELPV
uniref:beta-N-acetylhexosaminidase n=1 Tax=Syphacia muris TaxID=451379 RepID=A0A0N5AIV7_9BILA